MESQENYHQEISNKKRMRKEKCKTNRTDKRSFIGFGLIFLGLLFIGKKSGLIPSEVTHYVFSWPSLFIGLGLLNIFVKQKMQVGLIFLSAGLIWMAWRIFDIPVDLKDMMWPIIAVVVGALMVTVKNRHRNESGDQSSEHYVDMLTLFGGGSRKITSDQFSGGKVTSVFGGSEIDLTGAKLKDGECVVDFFTMFGGSEVAVPRGWEVHVDVVSIFGGFEDKRGPVDLNSEDGKQVLIVKGFSIFGGGEVKSY
ncbi:cell wall-active antibiotics response protein [Vicingaceae bacterium]|nr:cell wall-active antibiotics response protein [Vicingaceae bacterium]